MRCLSLLAALTAARAAPDTTPPAIASLTVTSPGSTPARGVGAVYFFSFALSEPLAASTGEPAGLALSDSAGGSHVAAYNATLSAPTDAAAPRWVFSIKLTAAMDASAGLDQDITMSIAASSLTAPGISDTAGNTASSLAIPGACAAPLTSRCPRRAAPRLTNPAPPNPFPASSRYHHLASVEFSEGALGQSD